MLIDTHCHIHNSELFAGAELGEMFVRENQDYTAEVILKRAAENNVRRIIVIGTSHADSLAARDFAEKYTTAELPIFWTYGIHPSEFEQPRPAEINLEAICCDDRQSNNHSAPASAFNHSRPVAIGEVGLDYHYGPEAYGEFNGVHLNFEQIQQRQFRLLEEMLDLAVQNNLPLSFHVREAFADFFAVVDNFSSVRGVVHCFTDNKKNLQKALDRDFYIGVDGVATYSTLPLPPLERTLLETDSPFLAPVPHRHAINQPAYVKEIAEWVAEKNGVDFAEVEEVTAENAKKLFKIS